MASGPSVKCYFGALSGTLQISSWTSCKKNKNKKKWKELVKHFECGGGLIECEYLP